MQSEIRNMSIECDAVGGINLSQGVCDTEVPEVVRRAAQRAIDDGQNSYTRYDGTQELREAIARKVARYNGVSADPDREIIVSAGTTGAFYCACLALLDPGDEVILFEPFYGYHLQTIEATDLKARYVRLNAPIWSFRPQDLEEACTPKTRAIMVNTPANPTGKVFTREELGWIADFARRHDMLVFTDEIYEHFAYDGRAHVSPMTIPGLRDRTIMIAGLSKTFSVTGWRIGYAIADARWAQTIGYFNDLIYVCAPSPLQAGVAAGLQALDSSFYERLLAEYGSKRERLCSALTKVGLTPCQPEGAYYIMADISRIPGRTSKERAMAFLATAGVAFVPGDAFHREGGGEGLGRFCYAKRDRDLDEACRRIERWRP